MQKQMASQCVYTHPLNNDRRPAWLLTPISMQPLCASHLACLLPVTGDSVRRFVHHQFLVYIYIYWQIGRERQ